MMGSYTLLLLFGLGVALATAIPLQTTTTTIDLTSSKAPITTSSQQTQEESSTIPTPTSETINVQKFRSTPLIYFNKDVLFNQQRPLYFPIQTPKRQNQHFYRDPPFTSQQGFGFPYHYGMPLTKINSEQQNEENLDIKLQTEKPDEDLNQEEVTTESHHVQERILITSNDKQIRQEDGESMVQQPQQNKMEFLKNKEIQYHRMIRYPMEPIPIMDSPMIPASRMEPMYRMSEMERQYKGQQDGPEEFDMSRFGPHEFLLRRESMENSEYHDMMGQRQTKGSQVDERENEEPNPEMSPDEEPGMTPQQNQWSEMMQTQNQQPQMMPQQNQWSEMMQTQDQEPEMRPDNDSEPEMRPDQDPESEMKPDQIPESEMRPDQIPESEMRPDQIPESEMRPDQDPESEMRPDQDPESEMRPDQDPESEMRPDQDQSTEVKPDQNQEETTEKPRTEEKDESKVEIEKPEMNPQEGSMLKSKDELMNPELGQEYLQQTLPEDDTANMVEGYQDMWRGNMDIFSNSHEFPRMADW